MVRVRKYIEADVLTEAKKRLHHIFDLFDSVVVMFSGGKDSLAALHLTREVMVDRVDKYRRQDWIEMVWFTVPLASTKFMPDNFDSLVGAFLKLDSDSRRRFLRSAAAIYMAGELWDVSISSYFLACVQAIETLVDRPSATLCPTCGKNTGPGPTQLFREFVDKYCQTSDVDQTVVQKLYSVRSALAHGSYLFQIDEAPFAANLGASVASHHELEISRSALTLAKEAARNWLLS